MGIIHIEELNHLGKRLKALGRRTVWTNGVFDLLHAGHVHSLEAAKSLGDTLVVGINSDASAGRNKPGRPIVPAEQRAAIVAAIRCVDYVTIFHDLDPTLPILELLPDVICKGEDYRGKWIAGADVISGRVEYLPMVEGISTTSIIERIKAT